MRTHLQSRNGIGLSEVQKAPDQLVRARDPAQLGLGQAAIHAFLDVLKIPAERKTVLHIYTQTRPHI